MKQRHDRKRDILFVTYSENAVVDKREHDVGASKHISFLDAEGMLVRAEIHGFSKVVEHEQNRAAQTVRSEFKAKPGATETLGELDWELSDCKTGEVLGKGSKTARMSEVTLELLDAPDGRHVSTLFPLGEHFRFGLASQISTTPNIAGFALQALRDDEKTFCWDWFNVDSPTHATKIQESGELAIVIAGEASDWQIVRTEFLTEVSLRVARFGMGLDPTNPTWRIRIGQGSVVNWPRLVDGQLILP
ncbi:MAG: hypothetical protein WD716_13990 [Fimbriimonadaceae bacterium]